MRPPLRQVSIALRAAQTSQCHQQPPTRHFTTTPPTLHNPSTSSSVNETEISHFSALASSWWDPHGPSRPLHLMNPLRHDFIRSCLDSTPSPTSADETGLRYLDVGCGGGIFAESAARLPTTHSVTAIDPSPTILAVARAHAKRDPALSSMPKLQYLPTPIESLPLPASPSHRFDIVTLFEVIEHVDYPAAFLERVGQFVKPGGWLVLSTMARTPMSWFTTIFVAENVLGMVPRGTHDWSKYVNEGEMREFFAGGGVETGSSSSTEGGFGVWGAPRVMGVVFVPGLGWKEVKGSEKVGNYFLGVQKVG
ncbi:S-adenosyl-L-methionine-dependent methyltransferase [Dichotomopilus funicola]|uniref:Ubiquinone biosynthesis O-methyltransferase, mitochondrial n=1 Tax=Dichotomopilus funicola TaxID=1934379 RepID=A0AAN6VBI0_9PEZI|nr:S-adenosyl-L-methionine-dependent methyltransferase [Dichotomopilus funicola]